MRLQNFCLCISFQNVVIVTTIESSVAENILMAKSVLWVLNIISKARGKALMIVKHKKTGKIFEVYEIKNDRCGYPNFLIYKDSQWKWMSAKHFKPCEKVDVMNDAKTCNTI